VDDQYETNATEFTEIQQVETARVWLFQANPRYYDLSAVLETAHVGDQNGWVVTRYKDEMHGGDTVILWQSGREAGIYATGELSGEPYQRDWQPTEQELKERPYRKAEWRVDFTYTRILNEPVSRQSLRNHPVLGNMQVVRAPTGSNFRVTPEEWAAIQKLIQKSDSLECPMNELQRYFLTQGLHFSRHLVATYATALKTKGFVILSGLSGTGKTKLAQYFADLLGSDDEADNYLFQSVRPDWRDAKSLLGYYNPLTERYETTKLLRFVLEAHREQAEPQRIHLRPWLSEQLQTDRVKRWLTRYREIYTHFEDKTTLWHRKSNGVTSIPRAPTLKADDEQLRKATTIVQNRNLSLGERLIEAIRYLGNLPGNRYPWARTLRALAVFDPEHVTTIVNGWVLRALLERLSYDRVIHLPSLVQGNQAGEINRMFDFINEQVKQLLPDVADPLTRSITPWLMWEYYNRPVEEKDEATSLTPFFIILDEMNLARVEYYFADFLSVLEGGRDADGFTSETIKLHNFEVGVPDAEGRIVPSELRLPPNLYVVGTVNVDETTHAFSPKVLDRAFTIEMTEVDFENYPVARADGGSDDDFSVLADVLLPDFTRGGRFAVVNKDEIAAFVAAHDVYRRHLQTLNTSLRPHDLHFGYRVFDEIVAFVANVKGSVLKDGFEGLGDALDTSVLMKVLPKFHGPKGRIEKPLHAVLAWARDPKNPGPLQDDVASEQNACLKLRHDLEQQLADRSADQLYTYPRTALKTVRMLGQLYTTGFASFA
jgi:hypothetical protein